MLKARELSQDQGEAKPLLKAEVLPLSVMIGFLPSSGTSPVQHNISGMTASDLSDVCYCMSHEQARYQLKKCTTESGFVYSHNICCE